MFPETTSGSIVVVKAENSPCLKAQQGRFSQGMAIAQQCSLSESPTVSTFHSESTFSTLTRSLTLKVHSFSRTVQILFRHHSLAGSSSTKPNRESISITALWISAQEISDPYLHNVQSWKQRTTFPSRLSSHWESWSKAREQILVARADL